MQSWAEWLDRRLDYRRIGNRIYNRILPDGPSWAYTSASCLLWLLVIQCFTGLLLMATYSPSTASAWASVHFIDQTVAGRFLRGIHHYASHAMIIVFGIHLLRVLLSAAYRAPRELVWITGLILFPLVIVWTVTGNPLSASQKGVAQIQVEGNILAATPIVGPFLKRLLFGGEEVGVLTLTRLYFLHVGLMPLLVGGLCSVHLYQVIKHSPFRSCEADAPSAITYWPFQTVRNMVALGGVVGILSLISLRYGAPLYAPADPDLPFSPRPEWYFRWLFELRRHFTGETEFIATIVIPTLFLVGLMAVPFLDRFGSSRLNAICRALVVIACFGGWNWLTALSYLEDWRDADYLADQVEFEKVSARALELARTTPISEKGAIQLLRQDPQTQGPRIFSRYCASCHSHVAPNGEGIKASEQSAPGLFGIGTAKWIAGFLDPELIATDDYFGRTKFREGDMFQHIQGLLSNSSGDDVVAVREKLQAIASALAAEAGFEPQDSDNVIRGREQIKAGSGCTDCHRFHDQGELGTAPDLTDYASAEWLKRIISEPNNTRFYGEHNDRMPAFASDAAHPEMNLLSPLELQMLVDWLRGTAARSADSRHRD